MCGIAGVYRFDHEPVDSPMLERMRRATVHRGPDDAGVWVDHEVGLAHNRLAILDLSPNGHQPMCDPESGNRIVYNGEVYNFQEIRKELEQAGRRFRSVCDTEVILHAYRVWGIACLERFNGMFAFAIFDGKTRELFLARDRMGIKPLYYYRDQRQFVFASEIKAILRAEGVERRINRAALPELIAFRYLSPGRTMIENIHDLKPGHLLRVTPDGIREDRYWDISFSRGDDGATTVEGFQDRLQRSVRYRLIADVPVGCALSGGVDSSLVTALACEASTSPMKTFSIGFEAAAYDERRYAKSVAEVLGVENFSQPLPKDEFYRRLPGLTWHLDEPINHPNSVGIWLLAKLAREKVIVLLSGEGGDELMGGYVRFRTVHKLRRLNTWLPGLSFLAGHLPSGMRGKWGRLARELARDNDGRIIWSSAYMPSHLVEWLLGPEAFAQAEQPRRALLDNAPSDDPIGRHLYLELKTYLVSLLNRIDKMCMAHSLENRVPLLDHTLVEYACRMPSKLKVSSSRGKIALSRLIARRFDPRLFARSKMGFGLPSSYFYGSGLEYLRELVMSRSFCQRELVDQRRMKALLKMHENVEEMSPDAVVWSLAALELWARIFIDRPGEAVA